MSDQPIRRLILEPGSGSYPLARRVRERVPPPTEDAGSEEGRAGTGTDMDKTTLRLVSFPGELLKPCPGTGQGYLCCGYQILNVGTNCPLDCSYCILQAYMNKPSLRLFVNLPEALPGIAERIDRDPSRIWRIGTGEFTDSLALDHVAGWTRWLLPFADRRKNAVLELKTKTDRIEGLLASPYRDRIIVSWSLNSPWIAATEEHGAPGLSRRIRAAARCQDEGFAVGFHFDPLFLHPQWREGYERVVDLLDRFIRPRKVIWISMGAMRFMPGLKRVIRRRHPGSRVLHGEFVPCADGKMRYFRPLRTEMYGFLRELITRWHGDPGLYLCMESEEVWRESMGWSPGSSEGLASYLDGRAVKTFAMRR
jgi:spore photoproduct lyase